MTYMDLTEEFDEIDEWPFKHFYDGLLFYCNRDIDPLEAEEYIKRGRDQYGNKLVLVKAIIKGDDVDLKYELTRRPFERIRRITGYLVGTLDRFNDAKRAEERDRVKHGI